MDSNAIRKCTDDGVHAGLHNANMLDTQLPKTEDLKGLSPAELAALATQMLAHIGEQSKHIDALGKRIDSQAQGIKWRDAKIESITFQLARLKAWKFGAKTERMNAEQREIFEETCAADQASLEAQLASLQGATPGASAPQKEPRRQPKREALPAHLARVDQHIEPEDTHCPTPECGQPMVRVGEDVSERLDIVPAQFFVQRQIRGKPVLSLSKGGPAGAASCSCKSRPRRKSSTTRCQRRACRPTRSSAASWTTSPTTAKSRSTHARESTRRARRWRPGAGRREPS